MNGWDDKIISTIIGGIVTFVGYKFTQKKDHEKNNTDETNVIVKQYGNTFTRINNLYDDIDKLIKERNEIQRNFDKFASASNAKILELERQLKSANDNIDELVENVKQLTEKIRILTKKLLELGGHVE